MTIWAPIMLPVGPMRSPLLHGMKLFAANYALVCAHKWSHKFCLTNQGAMKARSCVWITLTSLLAKRLIRPTRFNSKAQSTQLLRVDRRNAEEENSRRSLREKCFANIRKRSRPPHLGPRFRSPGLMVRALCPFCHCCGSKVWILWFALARIGAEVSAMRIQEQKERFQKR